MELGVSLVRSRVGVDRSVCGEASLAPYLAPASGRVDPRVCGEADVAESGRSLVFRSIPACAGKPSTSPASVVACVDRAGSVCRRPPFGATTPPAASPAPRTTTWTAGPSADWPNVGAARFNCCRNRAVSASASNACVWTGVRPSRGFALFGLPTPAMCFAKGPPRLSRLATPARPARPGVLATMSSVVDPRVYIRLKPPQKARADPERRRKMPARSQPPQGRIGYVYPVEDLGPSQDATGRWSVASAENAVIHRIKKCAVGNSRCQPKKCGDCNPDAGSGARPGPPLA